MIKARIWCLLVAILQNQLFTIHHNLCSCSHYHHPSAARGSGKPCSTRPCFCWSCKHKASSVHTALSLWSSCRERTTPILLFTHQVILESRRPHQASFWASEWKQAEPAFMWTSKSIVFNKNFYFHQRVLLESINLPKTFMLSNLAIVTHLA